MNSLLEQSTATFSDVEEFLTLSHNALIHYSPQYLDFLSKALTNTETKYLTVRRSGSIEGVLPVAICTDDSLGTVVNSLPFFGSHGGPLLRANAVEKPQIHLELMQAFRELLKERRAISATLIENLFCPIDSAVASAAGLVAVDDRIGQCTALPQATLDIQEALFSMCHVKTRNAIRKGQKVAQSISQRTEPKMLQWLQTTHSQSISALGGIPKTLDLFQSLLEAFGSNARLYIGELDGAPISGLFVLLYRDTVEYFTPVVDAAHKHQQVLSSLIFEVMTALTKEGFRRWNWGGTWRSQEGVYRFKHRWGAQDRSYRYFNYLADDALLSHSKEALVEAFPSFYLFKY